MKRGFDEVSKVIEDELFEKGQILLKIDYWFHPLSFTLWKMDFHYAHKSLKHRNYYKIIKISAQNADLCTKYSQMTLNQQLKFVGQSVEYEIKWLNAIMSKTLSNGWMINVW